MAFESLTISTLIFDVCYISVTSDRAPGNCRFTATNAVLDNILAEVKERQITATACNFQKRMTRFLKKVGYVLQCATMLAQSATKNLQSVKVQGLQN